MGAARRVATGEQFFTCANECEIQQILCVIQSVLHWGGFMLPVNYVKKFSLRDNFRI